MEKSTLPEPIDVQLVSWNRPKMTKLVCQTIRRNTKPDSYHLIVFDNGSDKETKDMLINMHENGLIDELVVSPKNTGLEAARQTLLLANTYGPQFVSLDNDCLAPPLIDGKDWLERLYDLMQRYEDYAAISARTQVMVGSGNIFEEADEKGLPLVDFPHPGGSFRLMNTAAVYKAGGWDRKAEGRGSEETYIGSKLHQAGWKAAFATDVRCLHLFGLRNRSNETDRWGYPKDFLPEQTGHSDISHPALTQGDDFDTVRYYSGDEFARKYFTHESIRNTT